MNSVIIDGMSFAMPLCIIAIGGIYSERSGITNLALEGLQGFGAFVGALFVTLTAGSFASGSMVPFYLPWSLLPAAARFMRCCTLCCASNSRPIR